MDRRTNASEGAGRLGTAPALFVRMMLIVMLAEAMVMAILHAWAITGPLTILIDPLLLMALATPPLFLAIVRPLHRMARELARANAAKRHFLAALSHELRTPLTPVLAAAGRLESDPRLDAETRADIAMICRNVALEARLIDDLLDVTRISAGKLELRPRPLSAAEALQQALAVCQADLAAKRLRVQLRLEAQHLWVHGDPVRLQQVFWNLIRNAAKFTADGGAILIRCYNDPSPGQQRLFVEVSDTGIGIAPQALPRIFNAFDQGETTTTHRFGGLGLGLAIARHLAELHGGSIEARSPGPGKGATFRVALPTIAAPPPCQEPEPVATPQPGPPPAAAPQQHASLHLLLVEDHADTARIITRLLERHGYDVRAADSVHRALELAEHDRFDIVISDLGLPDGSGHDLMRLLHGLHGSLKGIAVSGYGMEEDIRRSREAGFLAHLTKPVDFQHLLTTLTHVASGQSAWDPDPRERRLPC